MGLGADVTGCLFYLFVFVELGHVLHTCEGDLVCKCTNEKIPYFNAPVYLENKSQIGKVDDIFGPMTDFVSLLKACIYVLLLSEFEVSTVS